MMTVVGLFLFFGLTGLTLWLFNEAIWRADDQECDRLTIINELSAEIEKARVQPTIQGSEQEPN